MRFGTMAMRPKPPCEQIGTYLIGPTNYPGTQEAVSAGSVSTPSRASEGVALPLKSRTRAG
jgi:hypothetical protein